MLCCSTCGDCGGGGFPTAYLLSTNNGVLGVWEPSNGFNYNYGPNTSTKDDYGHTYNDGNFFSLCGPGAADIALEYWPYPPNNMTSVHIVDPSNGTFTTWTGERMRGYMTDVAWQIQWPGWAHVGMMDDHNPSYGTTLYGMQDALNWEASGENTSDWANYFYIITWWNQSSAQQFHTDVQNDVALSYVPVVAEVDALDLPNWKWNNTGVQKPSHVYHYITIIGYDDNAGIYYYTDTCGKSTTCNVSDSTASSDGGIQTAPQSVMWQAITAVPVNQSTDPAYGDGGWVW